MWLFKGIAFVVGVTFIWFASIVGHDALVLWPTLLIFGFIFIFAAFPRSRANSASDANPAEDGKISIETKSPSLIKIIFSVFYNLILLLLGILGFVYLAIKFVLSKIFGNKRN